MGTNMVPSQDIVEDSFTFAKVGYDSFLEGRGLDKVVRVQACKVAHTFCWGCIGSNIHSWMGKLKIVIEAYGTQRLKQKNKIR